MFRLDLTGSRNSFAYHCLDARRRAHHHVARNVTPDVLAATSTVTTTRLVYSAETSSPSRPSRNMVGLLCRVPRDSPGAPADLQVSTRGAPRHWLPKRPTEKLKSCLWSNGPLFS